MVLNDLLQDFDDRADLTLTYKVLDLRAEAKLCDWLFLSTLDHFFIKYLESFDDEAHKKLLHVDVGRHLNEPKQIGEYRWPFQLLIRLQVVEFEQKHEDFAELRNRQLS